MDVQMDADDYIPDIEAVVQAVDRKDKHRANHVVHKNVAGMSLEEYARLHGMDQPQQHPRNNFRESGFHRRENGSSPTLEVPRRSSLGESSSSSVEELVVPQPSPVPPEDVTWIKQEDHGQARARNPRQNFPNYNDLGSVHRPQQAVLLPPSLDEMTKQKTTVTFGNLGSAVSSEDIEELCARYGEVFNAAVLKDAADQPTGYAVADFTSRIAAENCVRNYDNKMLDGLRMKCFIRSPPPAPANQPDSAGGRNTIFKRLGPNLPPHDRFCANRNTVYHRPEHFKQNRFQGVEKKKFGGPQNVTRDDLDRELSEYRKRGKTTAL